MNLERVRLKNPVHIGRGFFLNQGVNMLFPEVELLIAWATGLLPFLYVVVVLFVLDLIGGVLLSLRQKDPDGRRQFRWEKLADFAQDAALLLLAWFMAEAVGFLPIFFDVTVAGYGEVVVEGFGTLVYAAVVLKYVGSILGHIAAIKEYQGGYGIDPTGHNPWG